MKDFEKLKNKRKEHPELFGVEENAQEKEAKVLLDALYEEGIIPTYSFPKNVVSTYIMNEYGRTQYEIERGLDIAIGEYAARAWNCCKIKRLTKLVVFTIREVRNIRGRHCHPARTYIEDPNYLKVVLFCPECGWFGLEQEHIRICPFCGNKELKFSRDMLRPWDLHRKMQKQFQRFSCQKNILRFSNRCIRHCQIRMKYMRLRVANILEWHQEQIKELL